MDKRILIISKDFDLISQLRSTLEELGNAIFTVENHIDETILPIEYFDLIILDETTVNTLEAMITLRKKLPNESIPTLILTHGTADRDVFYGHGSSRDMILTKPFNPRELLAYVKYMCTRGG